MKTHDLIAGTAVWLAHRANYFNASDAAAMMGCSPHETRDQLIHRLHTGIAPKVNSATQRIFDEGHRTEALARPMAEEIIGQSLYPLVGTKGNLSASFDGLTMCETIDWEHKTLNAVLREAMQPNCTGLDLPMVYRVQMQQQCDVAGCEKALFTASKWDGDVLMEARHCWYTPDVALSTAIVAGWAQLEVDLALYIPTAAAPVVVATAVEALPAVIVTVSGGIQVSNNLALFQTALLDFIENRLILNPSTDQDFADQDVQIKAMLAAEAALDAVEVSMLAQVSEVDSVLKLKQMLVKLVRDNRLKAQKQLAARKEEIKSEIVAGGIAALREHVAALNTRLGRLYMPVIAADFAGAIKGKRTVSSLHDAVNTELARAKIEASAVADRIQSNLTTLLYLADDHALLFSDTAQIVLKAPDDLTLLVKARIAEHRAAEAAKEEWTRLRIRGEEQSKAEAAAREKVALEVAAALQVEREKAAEDKRLVDIATRQNAPQIIQEIIQAASAVEYIAVPATQTIALAANVVPMRAAAPAVAAIPGTPPTLKLGQIGERLGFLVTAAFLSTLGFEPAARDKNAVLFHESDFPFICAALVAHIESVQTQRAA